MSEHPNNTAWVCNSEGKPRPVVTTHPNYPLWLPKNGVVKFLELSLDAILEAGKGGTNKEPAILLTPLPKPSFFAYVISGEQRKNNNNYGMMFFMSKNVSLPKINSILQKIENRPKKRYTSFLHEGLQF